MASLMKAVLPASRKPLIIKTGISLSIFVLSLLVEKFSKLVFLEVCADYADLACVARSAVSDFMFFRNIVEINPVFAVSNHALCAENISVFVAVESCENILDIVLCVILYSFKAP